MVPYSTAALFRFRQELCVQALGVPGNSFISARPPKFIWFREQTDCGNCAIL